MGKLIDCRRRGPERQRSPVGRESHVGWRIERGSENQVAQSRRPSVFGFDLIEAPREESKGVIKKPISSLVELRRKGGRFCLGKLEGDGEAAVPNSAMVSTEVSHEREVVKEGCEHSFIEAERDGDRGAVSCDFQVSARIGKEPQAHDLTDHPDRRPTGIFLGAVGLQKVFVAPGDFLVDFCQRCGVDSRHAVQVHILVGMRAVAVGEFVGPAGAERDFAAFDAIHEKQAQPVIKTIKFPQLSEGGPWTKGLFFCTQERVPIAGKPKVVRHRNMPEGSRANGNFEAPSFKDIQLLVECFWVSGSQNTFSRKKVTRQFEHACAEAWRVLLSATYEATATRSSGKLEPRGLG